MRGKPNGQPTGLSVFDSSLDTIRVQAPTSGHVGPPKADWYWSDTEQGRNRLFLQLDFVWSLFRANPKQGN